MELVRSPFNVEVQFLQRRYYFCCIIDNESKVDMLRCTRAWVCHKNSAKFEHTYTIKSQHAPHHSNQTHFGTKIQLAPDPDTIMAL